MPECNDLWLGGSLSGSGISGGTSVNGTKLAVTDWSQLFSHGGISYTPVEVLGRAGGYLVGDGLPEHRFPMLNLRIKTQQECDSIGIPEELLLENTDLLLTLLANPLGNYLEVDLPDGTSRFLHVFANDPAPISQPAALRTIAVPLYSPDHYWRAGGPQSSQVITGLESIPVGGRVNVYDAILVFAGDGTFTHNDLDWSVEVAGSTGPVTVDLGERRVTQGGDPRMDHLINPSHGRLWGWFTPGANSVSSDVSVTVTWRNQWN